MPADIRGGQAPVSTGLTKRDAIELQCRRVSAVIGKRRAQLSIQKLLRAASPGSTPGRPTYQDVTEGIVQEELKGLSYMFWGRLAALAVLAVWALSLPFERSAGYLSAIAAFALLGAPPYLLARQGYGRAPVLAAFLMLDAIILTYVLVVPPPFYVEGWTAQLNLRLPNFLFLGIFLVGMSLSYSPWLVMWAGIAAIVAWSGGFLWAASLPDTLLTSSRQSLDSGLSSEAVISRFLDPRSVSCTNFFNQIVFLGLVTLILTATVWRSRQLVRRQVAAESARASLSRYFSPNIVRELSTNADPLDRPNRAAGRDPVRRHGRLHPALRADGAGSAGGPPARVPRPLGTRSLRQ
ncbi:hypothetical protein NKJ35_29010 [Mesorhizobium sp. M0136]|uniref:hypothetical protein n=1 Tax=Mesorhizobium sp. M0136 TaxID=2956890 RepID=UPI003337C439